MNPSSLEITEQEYLIKLRKDDFDLRFIYQLIKRIETEQLFFSKYVSESEEDIRSRSLIHDQENRFDRLSDK
jgi:hypothetical protein